MLMNGFHCCCNLFDKDNMSRCMICPTDRRLLKAWTFHDPMRHIKSIMILRTVNYNCMEEVTSRLKYIAHPDALDLNNCVCMVQCPCLVWRVWWGLWLHAYVCNPRAVVIIQHRHWPFNAPTQGVVSCTICPCFGPLLLNAIKIECLQRDVFCLLVPVWVPKTWNVKLGTEIM